jgi:hypothetical protein
MPDFLQEIISNDNKENNATDDNDATAEIADFNTKGSLKARLYCKNKKLMENVFNKKEITEQRDSFASILDKSIN